MKKLSAVFLGAAIALGATAAGAQNKPDNFVDTDMKTRLFTLDEKWNGDRVTFKRGMSDDAVGVVCEWEVEGSLDRTTKYISAGVQKLECKETKTVPKAWQGGTSQSQQDFAPSHYQIKPNFTDGSLVIEERTTDRNSLDVSSTYTRVWDFTANKVCLEHSEGQYAPDGNFNKYLTLKNGCHAIPKNDYAQKMRQALKVK